MDIGHTLFDRTNLLIKSLVHLDDGWSKANIKNNNQLKKFPCNLWFTWPPLKYPSYSSSRARLTFWTKMYCRCFVSPLRFRCLSYCRLNVRSFLFDIWMQFWIPPMFMTCLKTAPHPRRNLGHWGTTPGYVWELFDLFSCFCTIFLMPVRMSTLCSRLQPVHSHNSFMWFLLEPISYELSEWSSLWQSTSLLLVLLCMQWPSNTSYHQSPKLLPELLCTQWPSNM